MKSHPKESDPKIPTNQNFGFTFAGVFFAFAIYKYYRSGQISIVLCAASMIMVLITLVAPSILRVPNLLWAKFGMLLHKIVSPIMMGLIFFVIVTPMGLWMRARGKDPMNRKWKQDQLSYWAMRDHRLDSLSNMKNQF
jgi:hypothetical protein